MTVRSFSDISTGSCRIRDYPDTSHENRSDRVGTAGHQVKEDPSVNENEATRNQRQIDLMAQRLLSYRDRTLNLQALISDLDSLWVEVEAPKQWKDEFRGHWWTLEQVNAVAIDRSFRELPADLQVMVDEAVSSMLFLLEAPEIE